MSSVLSARLFSARLDAVLPGTITGRAADFAYRLRVRGFLLAAMLLLPLSAAAEIEGLQFTSKRWNVEMKLPRGWRAVEQPSYPQVILWAGAPASRAQLVLTAEPMLEKRAKYLERVRKAFRDMEFQVTGPRPLGRLGATLFQVRRAGHVARVAVVFSPDKKTIVSLSLTAPTNAELRSQLRTFDVALRSLEFNGGADGT